MRISFATSITTRIIGNFLIVYSIVALGVGVSVGVYANNVVQKHVYAYFYANNRARAEHIRTFIQDQETTAAMLAAASVYRDFLREPEGSAGFLAIKKKIDSRLVRTLEADTFIREAFILDRNGKIIASSDRSQEGVHKARDAYFLNAKSGVYFKDIYFSQTARETNYAIAAPVIDDDGTFLGVSVLRYLPKNIYTIVTNEFGLEETEESFLVNKDKLLITPSRYLTENDILNYKIDTLNVQDCYDPEEVDYITRNGYAGIVDVFGAQLVHAKDYRGIDVLATHAYIPETGWCLIAKADSSDVLSFQWAIVLIFSTLFVVGGILFVIIGYYVARNISGPIRELREGVEKMRRGSLNYSVGATSQDEIGELARGFNEMALVVQDSRKDIERKVKEQTKELAEKSKDLADQRVALLNILEDVEIEKQRSVALANDLEKFKLAVDTASDQIVITDSEGMVVYGNRAIERITGYKPEEALGKKAAALWKSPMPTEYYKKMWDTIKIKKQVFSGEIQNKRKNGEIYTADISIAPVLDNMGNIAFFVAIEHDITKEKEIDRAKTEFVSLASHQLRTPLSAINWYAEMLLAGDAGKINKEQKKYLNEIYHGNQRMVDLVNALLNVSRIELGTFVSEHVPTDIIAIAKSTVQEILPMSSSKSIEIKENYEAGIPTLNLDPKLKRIIFQNLISNAVKYTPEHGHVEVGVAMRKKGRVVGGMKVAADALYIFVADDGYGIPEGQRDKIFSKLFRADNVRARDAEGTGLGLYLVKSVVEQEGGQVWFVSEENKGTTFHVLLPLSSMKDVVEVKKSK